MIVNKETVSVMICDDSALMRNLVGRMIENAEGLELVGKAMNGRFLLQKIPRLNPDVIILDLEMPEMNGIEFLRERKELGIEIPVVILSSIAQRGARITMEALSLGAVDFIMKPSGSISEDIHVVERQVVETVYAYGLTYRRSLSEKERSRRDEERPAAAPSEQVKARPERTIIPEILRAGTTAAPGKLEPREAPSPISREEAGPLEICAIGISTGGPNALRIVFSELPADFPLPIVVVQHMPAGFTTEFAKSLDRVCPLEVKEAEEGDLVRKGRILIAPGNFHISVSRRRLAAMVSLSGSETVNGHRPSADVLFESVAAEFGGKSLAVIMTGMGRDGARKIGEIHRMGGITVAQDEPSSIVYGMPRVAAELGHIQQIVSLKDMAKTLTEIAKEFAIVREG
jgi:two-component system chemotaxis response regulator CheB